MYNDEQDVEEESVHFQVSNPPGDFPLETIMWDEQEWVQNLPPPEEIKFDIRGARQESSRRSRIGISFTVLLVVIVAIAISATLGTKKAPEEEHFHSRVDEVVDFLSQVTDRVLLNSKDSPQYKAAAWIADDDNRRVEIPDSLDAYDAYHFIQRFAMATFYHSLNGEEWNYQLDFLTNRHECTWHAFLDFNGRGIEMGARCNEDEKIISLLNAANNLKGTLPPELGLLDELVELDLHNNRLEGQLSSDLSRLQKLTHLDLSLNNFQGPMPELKRMTQLLYLSLAENKFDEGPVPEDWSNLVNLKELSLMDTSRTGPIPNFFGFSGRQLTQLDLSNNQLTGYIPRSLNKLSNLQVLLLEKNNIYGYADPICSGKSKLATFVSDCSHEIECNCCTKCCEDGDETCDNHARLANNDPQGSPLIQFVPANRS